MKGLLRKDMELLCCNRLMMAGALVLFLGMSFMAEGGGSFLVAYMGVFIPSVINSTISYDDLDRGMEYLMVLPITRKQYVYSKYLLNAVAGPILWILTCVLGTISNWFHGNRMESGEWLFFCAMSLVIMIFMASFMIPIQLKFGAEKARLVIIMVMAGIMGIVYLLNSATDHILLGGNGVLPVLEQSPGLVVAGCFLVSLVAASVSLFFSVRIQENKEW